MNIESKTLVNHLVKDCGMTASGNHGKSFRKTAWLSFKKDWSEKYSDLDSLKHEFMAYCPKRVPDAWRVIPERRLFVWGECDDWNHTSIGKVAEIHEFDDYLLSYDWSCRLVVLKTLPFLTIIVSCCSGPEVIKPMPGTWAESFYRAKSCSPSA